MSFDLQFSVSVTIWVTEFCFTYSEIQVDAQKDSVGHIEFSDDS